MGPPSLWSSRRRSDADEQISVTGVVLGLEKLDGSSRLVVTCVFPLCVNVDRLTGFGRRFQHQHVQYVI